MDESKLDIENVPARVQSILQLTVRRRAAGDAVSDEELLAQYPELAEPLASGLAKLRLIEAAGQQADASDSVVKDTAIHAGTPRVSGRLRIRCPHCREPFEMASDAPLGDIICQSCGSHFCLTGTADKTHAAAALRTLGHFDLVECVGMGSFGTVWRGHDKELDRTVAIKIPRRESMDAQEVEKFLREARATAQLKHPNIVNVHEVGRDGDSVYIVSDYVHGISLDDWLRGQQPTMRQAARLCATIAAALHHAHDQGVIHRDLKPANIMIDGEGQPHLTDFGLARREVGEVTMTTDGQVLGTPAYMSPEQAQGEAHTADRRSDVYSLGVILFQLLTGELPFRGNMQMLLYHVIHDEPPSPRALNAGVPKDLETIVLTCLEKAPARRYQTALEVADELERFRQGEPIRARPISGFQRGWRWCRRNRVIATVVSMVGLLLGTLAAVMTTAYLREEVLRRDTDRARSVAELRLAESQVHRGLAFSEQGDIPSGLLWLIRSLRGERGMPPHLRTLARMKISALRDQLVARPQIIHDFKNGMTAGGVSPDGTTIAIGFTDGSVYLISPRDVHELVDAHRGEVNDAVFSPDGTKLATTSQDGSARIWDVAARTPIGPVLKHEGRVEAAAFSPDSVHLATGDSKSQTRLWEASSARELREPIHHGGGWILDLEFHGDGDTILCADGGYNGSAHLWSVARAERTGTVFDNKNHPEIDTVAFSPSGDILATGDRGGAVRFWDANSGNELRHTIAHQDWVIDLTYNDNGTILATGSRDGLAKLWDAKSGAQIGSAIPHLRYVRHVAFLGDNRLLTVSDGRSVVWKLRFPAPIEPLLTLEHGAAVAMAAFSADGSRIVTASGRIPKLPIWDASIVKFWDGKTGDLLSSAAPSGSGIIAGAFTRGASSMLSISGSRDYSCGLLDTATGSVLTNPIRISSSGRSGVAVHPQGACFLAPLNLQETQLWDLSTGRKVGQPMRHPQRCSDSAFSPDGTVVATTCWDGLVRFWDTATGQPIRAPMNVGVDLNSIAFSQDGTRIATTGRDRTASIWDLASSRRISGPLLHDHNAWTVAFSPNGDLLAVASGAWEKTAPGEASVTVWSVSMGRMVAQWEHPHHVSSVAFRPDGKAVASSCFDGKVRVWQLPQPIVGEPDELELWAEVMTGMTFQSSGASTTLDGKTFESQKRRLQQLGGTVGDSPNDTVGP